MRPTFDFFVGSIVGLSPDGAVALVRLLEVRDDPVDVRKLGLPLLIDEGRTVGRSVGGKYVGDGMKTLGLSLGFCDRDVEGLKLSGIPSLPLPPVLPVVFLALGLRLVSPGGTSFGKKVDSASLG